MRNPSNQLTKSFQPDEPVPGHGAGARARPARGGIGAAVCTLMVAGCGFDDLGIPACPAGLLPGDLVVTEIMADPGDGPGGEWLEIFNPSHQTVELAGLVLAVESHAEHAPRRHVLGHARVAPGAYFVIGSEASEHVPVGQVYGDAPGMLPDSGGRLVLRCDVIEVDAVEYPAHVPGVSIGLGSAVAPDAEANDDIARWCPSTSTIAPGLAGSPGAVNEACPDTPAGGTPGGMCEENGILRAPVPPAMGDVIITEIMANPDAAPDADGEWIELYVAQDVDLVGLSVGRDAAALDVVITGEACARVTAGSHVVLAATADPARNGGLDPVAAELGASLANTGGAVVVGLGDTVLDAVAWSSAPAGASLALDPAHRSPAENDDAAHWCASERPAEGSGDAGTPGSENPGCAGQEPADPQDPPGEDPPGAACDDAGTQRPIVPPAPGSVRITEIMADPGAVPDSDGEWIELRFDADADLNGLALGKEPGTALATIESPRCLRVTAGSHVVLAHLTDAARNGGLPRVDGAFGFSLVNGGGSLFVGAGGVVLDSVTHGAATAGASASLDEADDITWCASPEDAVYGSGDRGSPAAPNPTCDVPPAALPRYTRRP